MATNVEKLTLEYLPPGGQGTGDATACADTAFTAASSAAVATGQGGGPPPKRAYMTFVASTACHIRFGDASTMADATTSDFYLPANTPVRWFVNRSHYKVVRDTADGTLFAYRSCQ